jgi:hypothetical protein
MAQQKDKRSSTRSTKFNRGSLPAANDFYRREGFTIGRPNSKGWAMVNGQPPCHNSKSCHSLSVNLNHGGFGCFGCGAKGDMVAYVRLRDHCDFKTAAKTLGGWREGLTEAERVKIT